MRGPMTNAPTHEPAHRGRPMKWRATRRIPEPRWPPRLVHRAAMQRRPVQREGRPPLAGRLPPSGRGASGERGAPYMLSAGADASRSGISRRAKRRPLSVPESSMAHAATALHGWRPIGCRVARGGKSGVTRPRLLAAAAAQLAAEHGARRRAQLRPAPLPLCSVRCARAHSRPPGSRRLAVFALIWGLSSLSV